MLTRVESNNQPLVEREWMSDPIQSAEEYLWNAQQMVRSCSVSLNEAVGAGRLDEARVLFEELRELGESIVEGGS